MDTIVAESRVRPAALLGVWQALQNITKSDPAMIEMSNGVQDQISKGKPHLEWDPSDAKTDGRGKDALSHPFQAARGRATVQGEVRSSDGIGGVHAGDIKAGGPP